MVKECWTGFFTAIVIANIECLLCAHSLYEAFYIHYVNPLKNQKKHSEEHTSGGIPSY